MENGNDLVIRPFYERRGKITTWREVSGGSLCRRPLLLHFSSGDTLIAKKDFLTHPILTELYNHLLARARSIAQKHPEMEIRASESPPINQLYAWCE